VNWWTGETRGTSETGGTGGRNEKAGSGEWIGLGR